MHRSSHSLRSSLGLALALALIHAPALGQSGPLRGLDAYIESSMRAWDVPGFAIAVVKGDSVVFARGYGVREIGKPDRVDENTVFAIASTSKAFTAAALGMLVDEKKLRWDDPAARHLPGFQLYDPYVTRELTVRDLLSHRSGLPRGDRLWWGSPYDRREVLRRVRFLEPSSSFRSSYGYQNIMFIAAGEIIPSVTGTSWDEFLAQRIFRPLGMTRTSTTIRALPDNVATPHMEVEGVVRPIAWRSFDNVGGAGSMNSSVADMARWLRLMLGRGQVDGARLLSDSVVKEMHTPQTVIRPDTLTERLYPETSFRAYGLGWSLQDYRGHKLVSHGGSLDGMRTQVSMIPALGVGVVAISNMDGSNLQTAIAYRVLDAYLGRTPSRDWSADLLALRDRGERQEEERRRKREAARVTGTRPSLPLERYAGVYADSLYGRVEIAERGGRLIARMGASFEAELEHWHFDTFRATWNDPQAGRSWLTFRLNARGEIAGLEVEGLGDFQRAPEAERAASGR